MPNDARTRDKLRRLDRRVDGLSVASGSAPVPASRLINTTAPLTGGASLSGDVTLGIAPASSLTPGSMSAADKTKLDGVEAGATADVTDAGTWTPTLAGVANVASIGTIYLHHYHRVGNEVSFSGTFVVTPTASATITQISVTVPIASAMADTLNDASGVANAATTAGFVRSDGAGKLLVQFTSVSTAAHSVRISGHYRIN